MVKMMEKILKSPKKDLLLKLVVEKNLQVEKKL